MSFSPERIDRAELQSQGKKDSLMVALAEAYSTYRRDSGSFYNFKKQRLINASGKKVFTWFYILLFERKTSK